MVEGQRWAPFHHNELVNKKLLCLGLSRFHLEGVKDGLNDLILILQVRKVDAYTSFRSERCRESSDSITIRINHHSLFKLNTINVDFTLFLQNL